MCLEDISLCACQRFLLSSFPCSQVYGVQHGRINAHENSSSSVCELAAYYREQLFGVSLEELIARKELERNVAAENEQLRMQGESCKLLLFYFLFDVYR